jgi:hypothetical protein
MWNMSLETVRAHLDPFLLQALMLSAEAMMNPV